MRFFPIILISVILFTSGLLQGQTPMINDSVCVCVTEIELTNDIKVIKRQYANCVRPVLVNFFKEFGLNKRLFQPYSEMVLEQIASECPVFETVTAYWNKATIDRIPIATPQNSIMIADTICAQLKQTKWTRDDVIEDRLNYVFYANRLMITSESQTDTLIYTATENSACYTELELTYCNNPYQLIVPNTRTTSMIFVKQHEAKLIALFEIEKDVYTTIYLDEL